MDSIYLDPSIASREDTNVDKTNIQTMYKMVDECRVKIMRREVSKKVLYLTNQQALLFDEDAMEHCIQAPDIRAYKHRTFVIRSSSFVC